MQTINLKYAKDGGYIYDENGVLDVKWDKVALLIDVSVKGCAVLLSYGDVNIVKAKSMVLSASVSPDVINPLYLEFDVLDDDFCEELNRSIQCTGYINKWLENMGIGD